MISFKEFKKMEMKVGTITDVEDMPDSQKLIKMKVDLGGEVRQVLAGLKNIIDPEEIKGEQYVFVTNLEPAKMMGQLSEAMILAAVEGEKVVLVKPEKEVSNGTMIE
jgi:methionyl-tRNA synthetase